MEFPSTDKIFSISEFISLINIGLKNSKAKIIGEVGQVQLGPTGHMYFTRAAFLCGVHVGGLCLDTGGGSEQTTEHALGH